MQVRTVVAVAAGGVVGALARYGAGLALPHARGGVPWAMWLVNVSGCLLIGVLLVLVTTPLVRAFLGTGVLGGYTTFSTAMTDGLDLIGAGRAPLGLLYLGGTLVAALVAVACGAALGRAVAR